jgi:hypothetical protein
MNAQVVNSCVWEWAIGRFEKTYDFADEIASSGVLVQSEGANTTSDLVHFVFKPCNADGRVAGEIIANPKTEFGEQTRQREAG